MPQKKETPKGVDQALKDLQSTHRPLASKAHKAAEKMPQSEKERTLAALADLDALLPEREAAARDFCEDTERFVQKSEIG